jgi:hypothetical protein
LGFVSLSINRIYIFLAFCVLIAKSYTSRTLQQSATIAKRAITMESLPVDHFVKAQQFVGRTHRDVYSAIDPSQASLSQKGKVVVITGASQGLGARVRFYIH